jgi:Leucine-rich repeat (LRR) protein
MSHEVQQELGALLGQPSEANITRAEELCAQSTRLWWPWLETNAKVRLGAAMTGEDTALSARIVALMIGLSHGSIDLQDMELGVVPAALEAHAGKIRSLDLSGNKLRDLPGWLLGLSGLETLNLGNNPQLAGWPEVIPASASLKTLHLNNAAFKLVPDDLSNLSALTSLDLSGIGLTELPASLGALSGLEKLELERNKLAALPDEIGQLTALKRLNLKGNQLTALPDTLANLSVLEELVLSGNKLKGFPRVLLSMSLKTVDGIPGYMKKPKKENLQKFLRKLKMVSLATDVRERIFEMFEAEGAQSFDLMRHFEAQQVDYDPLRRKALDVIFADEAHSYAANPLKKGAVVTVMGKTTLKKTEIKEKFGKAGLVYSANVTDKVTHVVVGPGAKDFYALETQPCTFLDEKTLVDFLDSFEDNFLLEPDDQTQESVGNVGEMLMSVDESSQALGIEMLKAGGVPATLMTELFVIASFAEDKKLKEAAKKLIKLHGTDPAKDAIKDRTKILSTAYDKAEKLTAESIWYYHRHYGRDIDFVRVALWMSRRFGRGLRFVLDLEKPGSDARKEAVGLMIKDGVFDLYNGYATYRPDYLNPYSYYDKLRFPTEVLDHPEVVEINALGCNLSELPADLDRLVNLKILNLDYNMLSALPDALANMKQLEVISIQCNELTALPPVLLKMPWLKRLDLRKNRNGKQLSPIVIPDADRAALAGCELLLD